MTRVFFLAIILTVTSVTPALAEHTASKHGVSTERPRTPTDVEVTNHMIEFAKREQIRVSGASSDEYKNYFQDQKGYVTDKDTIKLLNELYKFTGDPAYLKSAKEKETATVPDPLNLPKRFVLHERFWTAVHTFDIEAGKKGGPKIGQVKEKFWSVTPQYYIYDAAGKKVGSARAKFFALGSTVEVFDAGGKKIGTIKEDIWKSLFKVWTTYHILDANDKEIAVSEKEEGFATTFDMHATDGTPLLHMERPFFRVMDTWTVDMLDKTKVDPRLLFMSAIFKTAADNTSSD